MYALAARTSELDEDGGRGGGHGRWGISGLGGNEEGKGRRIGDCQVILTPFYQRARIELGRSLGRMVVGRPPSRRIVFDLSAYLERPYRWY
eukprot:710286-Hanusia_phi.AAC.1